MSIPTSLRWPLLCVGGFLGLTFSLFLFAGLGPIAAADASLAVLAGTRPQMLSFSEVEALHPSVVLLLFGCGLVVRIFLIAYWAAYLVRKSSEASGMRKLRRQLQTRMRPETEELPTLRSVNWN